MKSALSLTPITAPVAQTRAFTKLVVAMMLSTALVGCSHFHKSAKPVNQPTALAPLTSSQSVLRPVFSHQAANNSRWAIGKHHQARKTSENPNKFHLFGNKKVKTALQQTPSPFQVWADELGYITASQNGVVTATDLSGRTVWQSTLPQGLASGVAADGAGTTVIVSDPYGKLVALDRRTGVQRWQSGLGHSVLAPALITGNRVISLANNGGVYANSLATGELLWQFTTQNPALSVRGSSEPVLLDDKTVLIAAADGRLHAINLDSGVPLWSRRVSTVQGSSDIERLADVDATPVVDNHRIYSVSYSGQLVVADVFDPAGGFGKTSGFASIKSLAVGANQLYVTTLDGKLLALDKQTGNLIWENSDLLYRGLSNPVVNGDVVLVGDALGYIHAINGTTGKVIDRAATGSEVSLLKLAPTKSRLIAQNADGGFSVWQLSQS